MKRFSPLILVLLLVASRPARAEDPEDQYLRIMTLIEQADSFSTNRQSGSALAKYQKAQVALRDFQKVHPTWNAKLVSYRTKYLAERVAVLTAPPPPTETTTPTDTPESRPGTAQVRLIEAGAEPRQVLRLHPKPGDQQSVDVTLKIGIEMKAGEMQIPAMKLPAMTLKMDTTIKDVTADGDITYEMVMSEASIAEDADVLPQVAEAMKASLASVKGLAGTGRTSNRGMNKTTDLKAPAGAAPQLQQALDQAKETFAQIALVLPEQAVGAGAKWEAKMLINSQGMTINQTMTYELVSIEGERITAKCTISQTAANQKIQNPAMPGLKLDLKKMTGRGSGEITLDLTKLMASTGNVDSHSEASMEMNAGGQKQPMEMKTDVNLRFEAK